MTVKVAKLLVGVTTLYIMSALWNVVILLHETGRQGNLLVPRLKPLQVKIMYSMKLQQCNHSTNALQVF